MSTHDIAFNTEPFFKAVLPVPPGINESYKIVSVPVKSKSQDQMPYKRGTRVYHSYAEAHSRPRMVHRMAATEKLEAFKQECARRLVGQHELSFVDLDVVTAIHNSRLHVPLCAHIQFFFANEWRRDVDGGVKSVLDVVFTHLGLNDNLIVDLHATKEVDTLYPRCEVSLRCAFRK